MVSVDVQNLKSCHTRAAISQRFHNVQKKVSDRRGARCAVASNVVKMLCNRMKRLVCLIFKVFSSLLSNFKSLWTKVSCCVQKANRRVYYIGRYEHLIGRYGRIATRYVHITARYA